MPQILSFSRMRSKVSRFMRSRSQPFATVRNRSQPSARSPYGRAYGKFCRRGHFWRFPTFRCFVSRGRRGTLWRQGANSVAGVACCDMCWKLTEASHETSILRLQILDVPTKTRRKTLILKLHRVKIGGSLARNARFGAPTCFVSSLWFSRGFAVSMGEAAKPVLLSCCQMWKLPDVSYEMLVFLHPRVLSRVAGFPVASPCLWGKLENLSYSNVSKSCRFAWQAWHFVTFQPVW